MNSHVGAKMPSCDRVTTKTENKCNVVNPNDIKAAHAAESPKAQVHDMTDMTEPKEQGGGSLAAGTSLRTRNGARAAQKTPVWP